MSLLLALGGLISLTAVVTGVSVTIAQSAKGSDSTHSPSSPKTKQEEKFEPTVLKECTVFLTSTNDSYTIVSCEGETAAWYLFDKDRNSLDKIAGISTPNSSDKKVGRHIDLWKDRNWRGFKSYSQTHYRGSDEIGNAFPIDYTSKTKEFPLMESVNYVCHPPTGVQISQDSSYVCSSLSKIDIPATRFSESTKRQEFKNAFNHNSETRCYGKDKKGQWKAVDCGTQIKSQ